MVMGRIRTSAAAAALLLAGCTQAPLEVTDRSFGFEVKVEQRETGDRDLPHFVTTLTKGDPEEEYTVDYDIDGSRDLSLQDAGGRPLNPGMKVRFGETRSATFRTDMDEEGEHTLRLKLSTGVYSMEKTVPFKVTSGQHRMQVRVDTSGARLSTLEVSLLEGKKDRDYSIRLYIDGKPVVTDTVQTCRFDRFPVFRTDLPLIRPGEHTVSAVTGWNGRKDSTGTNFLEPLRYDNISMEITRDIRNVLTVKIKDNPYGLRFTGTGIGHATGQAEWYDGKGMTWSEPQLKTSVVREDMQVDFTAPDRDGCILRLDLGRLAERLEKKTVSSAMWKKDWDEEGNRYWYVTGYEPVNYRVTATTARIFLDCEDMEGVWITIDLSAGDIQMNGIPCTGDPRIRMKTTNEQKWWEDIFG